MRFLRAIGVLFGVLLIGLTLVRAMQPADPGERYVSLYGQREDDPCCGLYLISQRNGGVNLVQLGVSQQLEVSENLSPSGDWRASYESTQQGLILRFLPTHSNRRVVTGGTHPGYIWHSQWSSQEDRLYYLSRGFATEAALFTATPSEPQPRLLSRQFFIYVRTMGEQALPDFPFSPLIPLGWGIWFVGLTLGASRLWQRSAR